MLLAMVLPQYLAKSADKTATSPGNRGISVPIPSLHRPELLLYWAKLLQTQLKNESSSVDVYNNYGTYLKNSDRSVNETGCAADGKAASLLAAVCVAGLPRTAPGTGHSRLARSSPQGNPATGGNLPPTY